MKSQRWQKTKLIKFVRNVEFCIRAPKEKCGWSIMQKSQPWSGIMNRRELHKQQSKRLSM